MGELSHVGKIMKALELATLAQTGCELTALDAIELFGHIDSLNGMIAELESELKKHRWIPIESYVSQHDGTLVEFISIHTKDIVSWVCNRQIDISAYHRLATHWRRVTLPEVEE